LEGWTCEGRVVLGELLAALVLVVQVERVVRRRVVVDAVEGLLVDPESLLAGDGSAVKLLERRRDDKVAGAVVKSVIRGLYGRKEARLTARSRTSM